MKGAGSADGQGDETVRLLALGSSSLGGQSGDTWRSGVLRAERDCTTQPEPITIDGESGLMCGQLALAWAGGRGYFIRLYTSGDEPQTGEIFNQAWFEDVLTTVRLPPAS